MTKEELMIFVERFPDGADIIGFVECSDMYYDVNGAEVSGVEGINNLKDRLTFGRGEIKVIIGYEKKTLNNDYNKKID